MTLDQLKVGDSFPILKKPPISRIQLVKYAGASGDFNPLHTIEEVGRQVGTGIIAHGMLVMGMAAQGITSWIPRQYIKKFRARFVNITFPGEEIWISGKVIGKTQDNKMIGEVTAMNPTGEVKLSGIFEAQW